MFLKNKNIIFKIRRLEVTDYAALTCGTRLFLTVTCPEADRTTNQVERTSTDTYRILTGCLTHENRSNRILTHKKHSSTAHLYPVVSVRSFEHVQNLSMD